VQAILGQGSHSPGTEDSNLWIFTSLFCLCLQRKMCSVDSGDTSCLGGVQLPTSPGSLLLSTVLPSDWTGTTPALHPMLQAIP
jgi:hypothetical protein